MSETLIVVLGILLGFPLFFGGLWSAVVGFASLGGWRKLASAYPAQAVADHAEVKNFCTVNLQGFLNLGAYRSSVTLTKDNAQLHMKTLIFFRPFHPPVSIPLSDISRSETQNDVLGRVRLETTEGGVPILVSKDMAVWILRDGK